jgi:PAS domain-containing protein
MVAALLPTLMVVFAAWLIGMSTGLVVVALMASAISLVVTFVATIGPRRHQDALDQIQEAMHQGIEDEEHLVLPWHGANPPPWSMTATTIELCRRLAERRYQLRQTMLEVTNALASLTHPTNPPLNLSPPPCMDQDDGRTLSSTYHIHLKNFTTLRAREIAMTALLKDMPLALIATDLELKVHYVNPAAEQLFGSPAAKLMHTTLTKLLVEPPATLLNTDVTLPHGLGPKAFYQKLLENKLKNLTVWIRNGKGEVLAANCVIKLGQHHVFQFIPVTDPIKSKDPASTPTVTNTTITATNRQLALS